MADEVPTFDIGDRPTATVTFKNVAGVLTDPTTVVFLTLSPAGTETPYTSPDAAIANPSVGVWTFTFPAPLTEPGSWYLRAKGTAGLQSAGELLFKIRKSKFTAP